MGLRHIDILTNVAAGAIVTDGIAKEAAVKIDAWPILSFPSALAAGFRRGQRKALLSALHIASGTPVIVDFSGCHTLNQEDIDLLLECMARVAGRDTPLLLVTGSRVIRILLELTRIASIVPVFNTVEEALAYPRIGAEGIATSQTGNFGEVRE
jgi:anti-anti-sigma regulatory factor